MKNVQISYELFVSLLRYHLVGDDDCLNQIRQGLEQKLDFLVCYEVYKNIRLCPYRWNIKCEVLVKIVLTICWKLKFMFKAGRREVIEAVGVYI